MPISLFANTDINDGIVNIYDSKNRTQPEVICYMKEAMNGKTVITDELHAEILKKEGIEPNKTIILSDVFEVDEATVAKYVKQKGVEHVVFGSQELYEAFFEKAVTVYMVRHHIVMMTFNEFPEILWQDFSISPDEIKKINTKKKYTYDLTLAVYRRKLRIDLSKKKTKK